MTSSMNSATLWVCFTLSTIVNIGCQPKAVVMTEKESIAMQTLTKKMTARCVGRYLVDLPDEFVLSSEDAQELEGVSISVFPMPETSFQTLLASRKRELESTFLPGKERYPVLKTASTLSGDAIGLIFDRAESDVGSSRMGRVLEVLAWKGGYRIVAKINAIDTNFPEFDNDAWIKESKTTSPEKRESLLNVLNRTRGRADNEIPSGQGTCIENGFISGTATDEESATIAYQLKNTADVFFVFDTVSQYPGTDTLLERCNSLRPLIEKGKGSVLRERLRDVAGIHRGEEYLYKVLGDPEPEGKRIMQYRFIFEGNNKIGSAKTPLLTVDFENGEFRQTPSQQDRPPGRNNATLSEAEALALWDAVIPTIRPRPGAF